MIFQSSELQSINTGLACCLITANAFDIIVKFGIITSSSFFIPIAFIAISKAAVPFETAIEYFRSTYLENFSSNFLTFGPSDEIHPSFKDLLTLLISL